MMWMHILNYIIFSMKKSQIKNIVVESAPNATVWYRKYVGQELEACFMKGDWWVNGNPLFKIPDSRVVKPKDLVICPRNPMFEKEFNQAVKEVVERYGYISNYLLKKKLGKPIATLLQKIYTKGGWEKINDRYYQV